MHIYIYARTHTYTYTHIHTYIHTYIYTYIHTYIIHTDIHTHTQTHTPTHTHTKAIINLLVLYITVCRLRRAHFCVRLSTVRVQCANIAWLECVSVHVSVVKLLSHKVFIIRRKHSLGKFSRISSDMLLLFLKHLNGLSCWQHCIVPPNTHSFHNPFNIVVWMFVQSSANVNEKYFCAKEIFEGFFFFPWKSSPTSGHMGIGVSSFLLQ